MYVNSFINFRGLPLRVKMAPSCLKQMTCFICIHVDANTCNEKQNELSHDPKQSHKVLAWCQIKKNLHAFETWIYVKACLVVVKVESHM